MQYSRLGLFIKNKRLAIGLSLNKFAFIADIDPAIVSRIENLKQGIKIEILEKTSKVYAQTPAEFLAEFEKTAD